MKKIFLKCFVFCISTGCLYCQNKTIKGRVISDNIETLSFVSIEINDSVKIGNTDLNGLFKIDIPFSVKKILFRGVGLEPVSIEIEDNCNEVEIIMMLSGSYDFISLKKADRLRMKKFNKLQKLHKKAFEKGIFKIDKVCYKQEFIHFCKKKLE